MFFQTSLSGINLPTNGYFQLNCCTKLYSICPVCNCSSFKIKKLKEITAEDDRLPPSRYHIAFNCPAVYLYCKIGKLKC